MTITRLEELSLNAWPSLSTLLSDGWVLRLAHGYTRRANSVQPLYAGTHPLAEQIAAAEALYAAHGLPAVFKLTPAAQPPELDEALAARGYALEAPTSVQALDLTRPRPAGPGTALVSETLTDDWLAAFCALSQPPERHRTTLRQLLESIVPTRGFFVAPHPLTLSPAHPVTACGLAVLEAGHVGLFDLVTHPAHRRQGHARALILDLLPWAAAHGAHTAYLQVMLNNAPALALYAGLGFEEVYRYWYRVKG